MGYSVYLGVDAEGRRLRKFFPKQIDAERYLAQRSATPIPIGELWEKKAEILYCLERLRPLGKSLIDVVSFYLAERGSVGGQKPVGELVEDFLREKRQVGRSKIRREKMNFLNRVRPVIAEIKSSGVCTLQGIADCLTRRGIPTRYGNTTWFPSTVKTVLVG